MSHKRSKIPIIEILEGHTKGVLSVAFHSSAPLLATGSEDGIVKLWDTNSQKCLATLVGHHRQVESVAFHPTADILMSGSSDNDVKLWDTNTYMCLSTTNVHRYGVSCVAFHPSKPFIVTSGKMDFPKLWQLSPDYTRLTLMNGHWRGNGESHPSVNCVAFHPSEPFIATAGSNSKATLWLLFPDNNVSWLGDMNCSRGNVFSVAFHPTLPILVTGDTQNVKLWQIIYNNRSMVSLGSNPKNTDMMRWYNVRRIDCIAILEGRQKAVTSVAFHPTAPVIVSGSEDTTIKLWRLLPDETSVVCMATLTGNYKPVHSVAFHPNGKLLASGNSGKTAVLWDSSVLTTKQQNEMALMRGVERTLVPRLFSGRARYLPYMSAASHILNKVTGQRGPNFFLQEEPARRAAAAAAAARAMASRRVLAITAPPRQRSKTPSSGSSGSSGSSTSSSSSSSSRKMSQNSPKSPKSPKANSRGGGASMTHRRKNLHSTKTRRYRRFR